MAQSPLPGIGGSPSQAHECGSCCTIRPVVRINAIMGETRDHPGVISYVYICEDCLAGYLERLTGYRIRTLLARWDRMSGRIADAQATGTNGG